MMSVREYQLCVYQIQKCVLVLTIVILIKIHIHVNMINKGSFVIGIKYTVNVRVYNNVTSYH